MGYEVKEFPPLTWSFSRMKMLKDCPRKYFFNYYGSHNGWLKDAPEETKRIYRLKNLQPIDAYFGQSFHDTVKKVVMNRDKELMNFESFRRSMNRTIKAAYVESKNSLEDWLFHPKWYVMFMEIYYQGDIPQEKKDSIIQKIDITSQNIFSSKTFMELTQDNADMEIMEMDEMKSFDYLGITAYLKIDALYRIGRKYVIADWKTSMNDSSINDVEQLLLYVWFANNILGIKLADLEARLEYIAKNETETYQFGAEELLFIDKRLNSDLEVIKSYLIDCEVNRPVQKEKFFQAKGSTICKYCNYREVC